MEDSAIREGFENLRSGTEYDALYEAAIAAFKPEPFYTVQIGLDMVYFHLENARMV